MPLSVILANPRGFCAGVRMAIDVVDQVLDLYPGRAIYVYHDIVHNRHVVDRFKSRGVRFVEDVRDVPEGETVVFSAHGVSPAVRAAAAERNLRQIDATCPLVTKVHSEAIRYARQGYQILLIGHRDHQEVIGTLGEAPEATQVVESPADIPNLRIDDQERLIYLTQTTLSTDDAGVIIRALKEAFPSIKAPPSEDICYATTNRQQAVRAIAPQVDLVLVVGSSHSSNSVRLTEIAANAGTKGVRVDDLSEFDETWIPGPIRSDGASADEEFSIMLTAGASAPEDLVAAICRELVERYGAVLRIADVFEEHVEFGLPVSLKRAMQAEGLDPSGRKITVEAPEITRAVYGADAVRLTVGGRSEV